MRALPQASATGMPPPAPGLGVQQFERIDEIQGKCGEIGRAVEPFQQRVTTTVVPISGFVKLFN